MSAVGAGVGNQLVSVYPDELKFTCIFPLFLSSFTLNFSGYLFFIFIINYVVFALHASQLELPIFIKSVNFLAVIYLFVFIGHRTKVKLLKC